MPALSLEPFFLVCMLGLNKTIYFMEDMLPSSSPMGMAITLETEAE
jgi:hypothetical protein